MRHLANKQESFLGFGDLNPSKLREISLQRDKTSQRCSAKQCFSDLDCNQGTKSGTLAWEILCVYGLLLVELKR